MPECVISDPPLGVVYVLDGGSMSQRLPWPNSIWFINLCQLYIQFIHRHFKNVFVVFDGYSSDPSTKDETHQRRIGTEVGVNVDFTGSMILKMKKKTFLRNLKNKRKFINLLSSEITKEGILVKQSVGDADYDIVMSALAHTKPVVVVADDTDILILLQHHFRPAEHESVYNKPAQNSSA